jgi:hypothetical protein
MPESPAERNRNPGPVGLVPPSQDRRRWGRWVMLALSAGMMGLAWTMGATHVLTLGLPFAIVAVTFVLLGDRWWAFSPRQQAIVGGGMVVLLVLPEIAAVNHLGWHDRLYATEMLAVLGFFTVVHFGIGELRSRGEAAGPER